MRLERITQKPEKRKANLGLSFHTIENAKSYRYRLNSINKSTVNLKCHHSILYSCPGTATLKLGEILVVPIDPNADRPRFKFDESTSKLLTDISKWGDLTCSNSHVCITDQSRKINDNQTTSKRAENCRKILSKIAKRPSLSEEKKPKKLGVPFALTRPGDLAPVHLDVGGKHYTTSLATLQGIARFLAI